MPKLLATSGLWRAARSVQGERSISLCLAENARLRTMHLGRVCTPWAGALFGRFRRSPFQSPRAFCHGMVYSRHYSQNLVGESSRTGVRPSMPAFTLREDDPESFHTFVAILD